MLAMYVYTIQAFMLQHNYMWHCIALLIALHFKLQSIPTSTGCHLLFDGFGYDHVKMWCLNMFRRSLVLGFVEYLTHMLGCRGAGGECGEFVH